VIAQSPSASADRVASALLQPWAMLAKGPPWMKAGVCSSVWTRQRVAQQGGHRASRPQVVDRDRPAVAGVRDDDAGQARPQVRDTGGQAEDGHDLAGDDDVEVILARHASVQPA
jgi:hypothetical protein